jgi:hypothetical protein
MSTQQHRTSYLHQDKYALCAVDMVGTDRENVEKHRYPQFEEVEQRIRVLPNIGELNERLKDATENDDGKVHINGGYQVLVSQDVIGENSVSFAEFLMRLKSIVLEALATEDA